MSNSLSLSLSSSSSSSLHSIVFCLLHHHRTQCSWCLQCCTLEIWWWHCILSDVQVCRQCWHSHPAIFLPVQPHRFVLQPDWHLHPQVRPFPLLPGSFVSHSICSKPSSILHPCWAMGSRCVMLQSAWLHMWMIQHDLFQWRPRCYNFILVLYQIVSLMLFSCAVSLFHCEGLLRFWWIIPGNCFWRIDWICWSAWGIYWNIMRCLECWSVWNNWSSYPRAFSSSFVQCFLYLYLVCLCFYVTNWRVNLECWRAWRL